MTRRITPVVAALLVATCLPAQALTQQYFNLTIAPSWIQENTVGKDADGNTLDINQFSLSRTFSAQAYWGFRQEQHDVRLFISSFDLQGSIPDSSNTEVGVTYRYLDFQAAYLYHLDTIDDLDWTVGAAAGLRQTRMRYDGGEDVANIKEDHWEVVPLLSTAIEYGFTEHWAIEASIQVNPLAQSRSYDGRVGGLYYFNQLWRMGLGYKHVHRYMEDGDAFNRLRYDALTWDIRHYW